MGTARRWCVWSHALRPCGAETYLDWGIDDPFDLAKQIPPLQAVEDVELLTVQDLVHRLSKSRIVRTFCEVVGWLPFYRNLVGHLRYEFLKEEAASQPLQ